MSNTTNNTTLVNYVNNTVLECYNECSYYPNVGEIVDAIFDDLSVHVTQSQVITILKQLNLTQYSQLF